MIVEKTESKVGNSHRGNDGRGGIYSVVTPLKRVAQRITNFVLCALIGLSPIHTPDGLHEQPETSEQYLCIRNPYYSYFAYNRLDPSRRFGDTGEIAQFSPRDQYFKAVAVVCGVIFYAVMPDNHSLEELEEMTLSFMESLPSSLRKIASRGGNIFTDYASTRRYVGFHNGGENYIYVYGKDFVDKASVFAIFAHELAHRLQETNASTLQDYNNRMITYMQRLNLNGEEYRVRAGPYVPIIDAESYYKDYSFPEQTVNLEFGPYLIQNMAYAMYQILQTKEEGISQDEIKREISNAMRKIAVDIVFGESGDYNRKLSSLLAIIEAEEWFKNEEKPGWRHAFNALRRGIIGNIVIAYLNDEKSWKPYIEGLRNTFPDVYEGLKSVISRAENSEQRRPLFKHGPDAHVRRDYYMPQAAMQRRNTRITELQGDRGSHKYTSRG